MTQQEITAALDVLQELQREIMFNKTGLSLSVNQSFTPNNHREGTIDGWSVTAILHDVDGIVGRVHLARYYDTAESMKDLEQIKNIVNA